MQLSTHEPRLLEWTNQSHSVVYYKTLVIVGLVIDDGKSPYTATEVNLIGRFRICIAIIYFI